MKKSFKRLLSCIFIITFFLVGMCLDRANVSVPEVDSFSVSEAKVFATPEPSVSDTMPCTTEMLGLVRTSITNLTADRSSSRNVLRIFMYIINNIKQLYVEAINMNILMIIGIILGGGVSVASTVGITVGIFGTIVYKFCRKLRFGISMFD